MTAVACLILRLLCSPILLPVGLIYDRHKPWANIGGNLRYIWTGKT